MRRRLSTMRWLVICLSWAVLISSCSQPQAAPAASQPDAAAPAAVVSSNSDVVSAEAAVVPWRETVLSFKTSGRIAKILVSEGDVVKEGQELARLESGDLQLSVAQAEAQLKSAQAQLAKVKAGARPEEVAVAETAVKIAEANATAADSAVQIAKANVTSAQAAVGSAQASLDQAKAGATPEQLNGAAAVLANAAAAVKQAQAAFDQVKDMAGIGMMPQSLQLEQATNEYNRAKASYQNLQNGATPAEIKVYERQVTQAQAGVPVAQAQLVQAQAQADVAHAQVSQAQAQLDLTKASSRPEDVAVAEAAVAQAQVVVDQAKNALADAILTAPFAGTVGTVPVDPGQLVSPQMIAMRLGDLTRLQVQTKDLSEADVDRVKVGQAVSVSLDALQGQKFTGKVTRIAPVASDNRGDQVYTVTADVDGGEDAGLRWGMTAYVDIRVR
jgi:HlyD family secretion protein